VLRTEGSNFEGGDGREAAGFYTFRGGAIAPYAPGARLAADLGAVVDADRDGRPDFTLPGPCAMSVACGEEAYPPRERGPMFLAHALASGGFSTDDAVAKRFVERQCVQPNGAERMVLTRAHDDAVSAVACDRIFGITEAEVIADLREVNAEQELCPALDALIDLARTEPPFVLEK